MYCIRVLDYTVQNVQGVVSAGFSVGDILLVRPVAPSTLVGWARHRGPFGFLAVLQFNLVPMKFSRAWYHEIV